MKNKTLFKLTFLLTFIFISLLVFSSCSLENILGNTDSKEYIVSTTINENGELIITYSNNTIKNLGVVVGKDGKDGVDGVDGKDGKDGIDGKDGKDGKDGTVNIEGVLNQVPTLDKTVADVLQSTVIIQSAYTDPTTLEKSYSAGAGVIYSFNKESGSAIIVTNYHVVYSSKANTQNKISDEISIYLYGAMSNESAMKATFVGGSMQYDIAVLEVKNSSVIKSSEIKSVEIRSSTLVHVGETAFAVGNPKADGFAVTSGIVSVDSEYIDLLLADDVTEGSMRVMRIDTPVNPGNSGGGLFDANGKLIGIVNAKYADQKTDNIGYAIPSSTVHAIVENILDNCYGTENEALKRPLLGVSVQVQNPRAQYNSQTGYVELYEDPTVVEIASYTSIAYGKLQIGDVIRKVQIVEAGMSFDITRQYHLLDSLIYARVGDTVLVTVERGGELVTVSMVITSSCITNS